MTVLIPITFFRRVRLWVVLLSGLLPGVAAAQTPDFSAVHAPWFEVRTAHFQVYSCGTPQLVYKLTGRLEQFCKAYALMAGSAAVASPPIVVSGVPGSRAGEAISAAVSGAAGQTGGFFKRGEDENLIVRRCRRMRTAGGT